MLIGNTILSHTMECNTNVNDDSRTSQCHIGITPQMIRIAVKKLQLYKCFVNSDLISNYLRSCYPVDKNMETFRHELRKKLDCAVHVGLIIKYKEDSYYLPTLRQEANSLKSAFTAFWEMYKSHNKSNSSQNRKNSVCRKRKYFTNKHNK